MEAILDFIRQIVLLLVPFKALIILSLLGLQVVIVRYVLRNVAVLGNIFKKDAEYKNIEYILPAAESKTLTWKELQDYNPEDSQIPDDKSFVINLPVIPGDNDISKEIEEDINNFLLKNKGADGGFDFIKDITERNCGALVEKIEDALPWPLYIGLMGTMSGIIFGIFSIPDFTEAEKFVPVLMNDVSYAMIISIVGIIGTTFLSWRSNAAKEQLQRNKNEFYSWFQTEMLPDLSRDTLSEGRTQLERNLKSFNKKFGENLTRLEDVFKDVNTAAKSYSSLLLQLERINIGKATEEQLAVITKFEEAAVSFRGLSDSLGYAKLTIDSVNERNRQLSEEMDRGVEAYRAAKDNLESALSDLGGFIEHQKSATKDLINLVKISHATSVSDLSGFIEDQKSKTTDLIKNFKDQHKKYISELNIIADNYLQRQGDFVVKNTDQLGPVFESIMSLQPIIEGLSNGQKNLEDISSKWNGSLGKQTEAISRLNNAINKQSDIINNLAEASKDIAAIKSGELAVIMRHKGVKIAAVLFIILFTLISGGGFWILWNINANMRKMSEFYANAANYAEGTVKTVNKTLPALNNKSIR